MRHKQGRPSARHPHWDGQRGYLIIKGQAGEQINWGLWLPPRTYRASSREWGSGCPPASEELLFLCVLNHPIEILTNGAETCDLPVRQIEAAMMGTVCVGREANWKECQLHADSSRALVCRRHAKRPQGPSFGLTAGHA